MVRFAQIFAGTPQDDFQILLMEAGLEHECSVLAGLGDYIRAEVESHTQRLVVDRVPLIYQPRFVDTELRLVAQPDFLVLEDHEYRVADAKLTKSIEGKRDIQIQLGVYQFVAGCSKPAVAYLPNGIVEEIGPEANGLADTFISDMHSLLLSDDPPEANFVASKCNSCPYRRRCVPEFEQQENLASTIL